MKLNRLVKDFKRSISTVKGEETFDSRALKYIFLGDEAFSELDYHKAIMNYSIAIDIEPDNHYPLFKRGKCFQLLEQSDRALNDFQKSNELDDNFENVRAIAECYFYNKEYSVAAEYFKSARNHLMFMQSGDADRVMGYDYEVLKARLLNNIGECYYQIQQLDKAIDYVTEGIEANPKDPDNYSMRGKIYLTKEDCLHAIPDLKNAARLGDSVSNDILARI